MEETIDLQLNTPQGGSMKNNCLNVSTEGIDLNGLLKPICGLSGMNYSGMHRWQESALRYAAQEKMNLTSKWNNLISRHRQNFKSCFRYHHPGTLTNRYCMGLLQNFLHFTVIQLLKSCFDWKFFSTLIDRKRYTTNKTAPCALTKNFKRIKGVLEEIVYIFFVMKKYYEIINNMLYNFFQYTIMIFKSVKFIYYENKFTIYLWFGSSLLKKIRNKIFLIFSLENKLYN